MEENKDKQYIRIEENDIVKVLQKINERLDNLIKTQIKKYPKIDYIKSLQDNDDCDE